MKPILRRSTAPGLEPLESRIAPAAAVLDLSTLDGTNGFKVQGEAAGDDSGFSVSGAGDVNGDGLGDFIIGAIQAGSPPQGFPTYRGAIYVIFGQAGGFSTPLDLAALDGTTGFKITGEAEDDVAGHAVSGAGDVNGDGFDDIIIGAYGASTNGHDRSGASYVVFGHAGPFGTPLDLATLDGTNGFKIQGEAADDNSGYSVGGAGDVNHDGFADVIIGAVGPNFFGDSKTPRPGASYVVFGHMGSFSGTLDLSGLTGANGFKILGEANDDFSGESVAAAGDLNGDGFADVIIGATGFGPRAHAHGAGGAYVVFGKMATFDPTLNLATLNGNDGFKILSETAGDQAGVSVSGAGDVNGDGFADLIIGANAASPHGAYSGAGYVIYGKAQGFAPTLALSSLKGATGFKLQGADFETAGSSVSGAGDVNGDGFADLFIGAPSPTLSGDGGGSGYVVFGKAGKFSSPLDLSKLNGVNGFKLHSADRETGLSVSTAGDVNGDGFADLIIGAYLGDSGGAHSGTSYVIYGHPAIATNGRSVTYVEGDGDHVTVTVTKGQLKPSDFKFVPAGMGVQLQILNLHTDLVGGRPEFAGTKVTISAKTPKGGTGDGVADVDFIAAQGVNLGAVNVTGRLEKIAAGDGSVDAHGKAILAVKSLTVGTLGKAVPMPGAAADYHSTIVGAVGALTVKGNANGMDFEVTGGPVAGIGKIAITGSLQADNVATGNSGFIHASGDIGPVSVGHDVMGGAPFSGLAAGGRLGKVSIGGALLSLDPAKPVTISALGKLGATTARDAVAIAGVSVKTDVRNARILAGYTTDLTPLNPDAGIGAISVLRNWDASSVAAGIQDTSKAGDLSSAADGFGQHDTLIAGDLTPTTILSTIASITIKGIAMGRAGTGDFFGITAQKIGKVSIPGVVFPLASTDVAVTSDFHLVTV